MLRTIQKYITDRTAVKIASGVEEAIREAALPAGAALPTVRALAKRLEVSPATVAAAYRTLQQRGMVASQGRRGTRVTYRPIFCARRKVCHRPGVRNLWDGNPDPALLPAMRPALATIDATPRLYGQGLHDANLLALLRRDFEDDGIGRGEVCVVNGAMDAIERVLSECLRAGDGVAVEDPGFGNVFDLVMSRGLSLRPVALDGEGVIPDELARACREGIKAVIITTRAHNPTGAAVTFGRGRELSRVLAGHPEVLLIEDDHAALIVEQPLATVHQGRNGRWVYVRSFSKALNPDLRLAAMTGDGVTMNQVIDRLIVGERWVSHVLQRVAHALLSDHGVRQDLARAARSYSQRREALMAALLGRGLSPVAGRTGYNVWVPVPEETATVQGLDESGWGVGAGERFRIQSPSAIRITAATLSPEESDRLASDLVAVSRPNYRTCTA